MGQYNWGNITNKNIMTKIKWVIAGLIGLLLLTAIFRLDGDSLLHSIQQIPLRLALLLFFLQIITQLLINLQWHQIARQTAVPISFKDMFYVNCQGAIMDAITPGVKVGGAITRIVRIRQVGNCTSEQSVAIVALQKLFSLNAMILIMIFAMGYLMKTADFIRSQAMQIVILGVLTSLLLLILYIFIMPHRIKPYLQTQSLFRFLWMQKIQGSVLTLLTQAEIIRKDKKTWVLFELLSFVIWLLYPAKMYILAIHFLSDVPIVYMVSITFASYLVAILPIFPGGLGGFEGTMSGLLVLVGFSMSSAAVTAIFFRFVTFWFVVLFSLAFVAFYKAQSNGYRKKWQNM